MRTVRCVSPHGGAHNGLRADNDLAAPPGFTGRLKLPPNEGGYVWSPLIGHVAVGEELDAPEAPAFIADGFHFTDVATGTGDVCAAAGDACWCGQHREAVNAGPGGGSGGTGKPPALIVTPGAPSAGPGGGAPANPLAGLPVKEND